MQLADMKWSDIAALDRDTPVVIPIAALEQHGRHMPLFTDSMLLAEVVRRAAEPLAGRVLFAPLMWLGNSEHHLDFPGTMSASPRVYLDLLRDMAENFVGHGFRRLVLLNGHGGNIVPAQQSLFELRQKHRDRSDLLLLSATYWTLGGKSSGPNAPDATPFVQTRMGHACEWETSMMLCLAPHLVGDLAQVEPLDFGNPFEPAQRAWITKDRTGVGHIGDPRTASAEKGESLFRAFSADVVALLERVIAWDGQSWDG
ncbi:MAG: creatininase family protein [Pirellulaceae bacterium]